MRTFACILSALLAALAGAWAEGTPIKHRFLDMDESRKAMRYVDEADPSKNWSITFPWRSRDVLNDDVSSVHGPAGR